MTVVQIRPARLDEVSTLNAFIARSARALSRGYYSDADIEALVAHVFGVDTQLIHDTSYFVVERDSALIACGGWSDRRTLFGGDQTKTAEDPRLDPACDAARIRAFFVDPDCARTGVGRILLAHAEDAARAKGFHRAALMATLPGVPFYERSGYHAVERVEHPVHGGLHVNFVRMERSL